MKKQNNWYGDTVSQNQGRKHDNKGLNIILISIIILLIGVGAGTTAYLIKSQNVVVPNVVNFSEKVAVGMLENRGLKLVVSGYEYSDEYSGYIASQEIEAGTVVKKGTAILVKVYEGTNETNTIEDDTVEEIPEETTQEVTEKVTEETTEQTTEETTMESETDTDEEDIDETQIIPYSSDDILTDEDVEGLSLSEIQTAINEICAREGRKFVTPSVQAYFESYDWYEGTVDAQEFDKNIKNYLTDIEYKNFEFLSKKRQELS